MFGIGMSEMLIIGVIALLLIGPDQIPETARTLGKFLNELRRSTDDLKSQLTSEIKIPQSIDDIINASNKANHVEPETKYENHPPVMEEPLKKDSDKKESDS